MDVITYLFHPQEKGHYLRREAVVAVVGGATRMGAEGKNGERSFNMQQNHSGWVMNSL